MTRREREVQVQMTTMQQHMESLLQVVNESTTTAKQATMLSNIVVYREGITVFIKYLCDGTSYCGSSFNNISWDYR